jgi:hypothetical protein
MSRLFAKDFRVPWATRSDNMHIEVICLRQQGLSMRSGRKWEAGVCAERFSPQLLRLG